jgi:hypothetical protein
MALDKFQFCKGLSKKIIDNKKTHLMGKKLRR